MRRIVFPAFALCILLGCGSEAAEADRNTADLGVAPPQLPFGNRGDAAATPPPSARTSAPSAASQNNDVSRQTLENLGHVRGDPDAPIKIVEFSDYGCGYCRRFHEETFPVLVDEFVNTGKVYWRTVQFNVGMFQNAQEAALAGECAAEQDRFSPMSDGLFASQREWKSTGDATEILEGVATTAGLNMDDFRSCMSERRREDYVNVATQFARRLGIRGTPTFFIEGFPIQGALPIEAFRDYINAVMAEKAKAG